MTAEKFLAVLTGDNKTAQGPVLKSNKKSKVFIYYADHGAPGFVGMPSGGYLYADKLAESIKKMEDKGMFKELVFYMEACEAGSMFPALGKHENVYAMTATDAKVSSWGTFCGSDAVVKGKNLGTCLGDLFSVNWMDDTETHDPWTETIGEQFERVKTATTKSPVCEFGDKDLKEMSVGTFEGTAGEEHAESGDDKQWSFGHITEKGKKLLFTMWN